MSRLAALAALILVSLVVGLIDPSLGQATDLVVSGESVTLQAPSGNYLYQWVAEIEGETIALGDQASFTFTAPEVPPGETKTINTRMLIRTIEGGCTNQTIAQIVVYPPPECGISGPIASGPEENATYSYSGGSTGNLTYSWSIDGRPIGSGQSSVLVDWSQFSPSNHVIGLTITRDYRDVMPGATNPTRSTECTLPVEITYASSLSVAKIPSAEVVKVGENVTYTYTIRNTGNATISGITLSDDKLGAIDVTPASIRPGETAAGTATYTIKESDLPGPIINTITARATDTRGGTVTGNATARIDLTYKAAYTVEKRPSKASAEVGEALTYSYAVRNTGDVTISGTTLSDDKLGMVAITPGDLKPDETGTGTATYIVVEKDLPGPLVNRATAMGTDSQGMAVANNTSASVALTYKAALNATKVPSQTTARIGDTISYAYTIRNTGNVTVSRITLDDDVLGAIAIDSNSLLPGETATGTASHTIAESDLPGPIVNIARVSAIDTQGNAVIANATASVSLTYTSALAVEKRASHASAKIGDVLTYIYTVRNTGETTISGISLNDDRLGTFTLSPDQLRPGETGTASAIYTVVEADLPGPIKNVVTTTGTDSQGKTIANNSSASVDLIYTASLSGTKLPSQATAKIGDQLIYAYAIRNIGDVTLNGIAVTDDRLGSITVAPSTLLPGETATGTATHTVAEADLPGPLTNIASIQATDSQGNSVTNTTSASVVLAYTSTIALTKVPSRTTAAVGDVITYTYSIKNTGNTTISGITLSDDVLGAIEVSQTIIRPGEIASGTATHAVAETDLPGPLTNKATAQGTDSLGETIVATAAASVGLTSNPNFVVQKTASVNTARIGDVITYGYTVTNTGDVTLSRIAAMDDKLGEVTLNRTTIAPGEYAAGTITYTVVESDLPGPIINVVTVTADDVTGQRGTNSSSTRVNLTYASSLTVAKSASVATAKIGDVVTYSYTINNTGDTTISDLVLADDKLGPIAVTPATLGPGEAAKGTATHVAVEADLPGPLANTASVQAKDSQGNLLTGSASAFVNLTYTANVVVEKKPSADTGEVGETVTYSYTVRNTGDVAIRSISLSDDLLGHVAISSVALNPGDTETVTASHLVTEEDLPGPIVNVAKVTARDSQGMELSNSTRASVNLNYTAAMTLTKVPSQSSARIGDTVTYTYSIRNTGTVTLRDIVISDDMLGDVAIDPMEIKAGESAEGTARYTIAEGDLPGPLNNTAMARAADVLGNTVESSAKASVPLTYASSLQVTKSSSTVAAYLGENILYSYTVRNTGDTTISGITLTDDKLGSITAAPFDLRPGDTTTGSAEHIVVQSDLTGFLVNNVTALGKDSQGSTVTTQATASVRVDRRSCTPILECVHKNADGSYTAFFGYRNDNPVPVDIESVDNGDNFFDTPPSNRGQPTNFLPGRQEVVFAADFDGRTPLTWHLDNKIAMAAGEDTCMGSGCLIDGPMALCRKKEETYRANVEEEPGYSYIYSWTMDGSSLGTGKSIVLSGDSFEMGVHTLHLTVNQTRSAVNEEWSSLTCDQEVKVIPEPNAEFSMDVEERT